MHSDDGTRGQRHGGHDGKVVPSPRLGPVAPGGTTLNRHSADVLRSLTRKALLIRVGLAILLHIAVSEATFAPDQETYDWVGTQLALYWSGDRVLPPGMIRQSGPLAYYYIVAAVYFVLGAAPLVMKILNAAIGAATVPLVHALALKISASDDAALRAARYAAFFPSLVLWSALNLRDVWIVALILLICHQAMALQESVSLRTLVVLASAILALTQFRDYILFAIAVPIVLSFLVRRRKHLLRNTIVGMLVAVVVIYADVSAGAQRRLRAPDLLTLQEMREQTGFGGSQAAITADISTPAKALLFLPQGIAIFLFAPFPWQISGVRQLLTLPEMLFLYALFPSIVRGVLTLIRNRLSDVLLVVLLTAGLTLGYALGQANVGTAYRYRAQVLPFYLIFAAVGVTVRREATARRSVLPVPA